MTTRQRSSRTWCHMELPAATKPTNANFVRVIRKKCSMNQGCHKRFYRHLFFCIIYFFTFETSATASCGYMLKYHLWNAGPSYHTGRLEELLILNRPCRPGEDVHDSVLPTSYWQAWKTWEHSKKEIEAKATTAGVIWFVGEEAVEQRIWEIISRDEIAMNVTYEEARATKRRRRDGPSSQAPVVSTKGT